MFAPLLFHTPSRQLDCSFMSIDYTTMLRAVAILMVMLQHLSGFVLGSRFFTPLGGGGVCIFLILSGYGLTMSANKKGLNDFWKKKFVRVFLPLLIVWLIMTIQTEKSISIVSLFSPNWFLQYIFVCYIIFYLVCKAAPNRIGSYICLFIFSLATFFLWGSRQAEQCLSFQIGIFLAQSEATVSLIRKNAKKLQITSFIIFVLALALKQVEAIRMFMNTNCIAANGLNLVLKLSIGIFVMMSCLFLSKYINGKYAQLVGKMSYELYLVHLSLAIGLCYQAGQNKFLQIAIFIISSFIISWLLLKIDTKILSTYSKYINFRSK